MDNLDRVLEELDLILESDIREVRLEEVEAPMLSLKITNVSDRIRVLILTSEN